jgi:DNA-binding transcriptional regulator YhcF (GntR family)
MSISPESAGETPGEASGHPQGANSKLSYKYQRVRELLRASIASGELQGKLPGERQMARRFRVNAKTLSKALTDLATEGLLDRSIGRGTFVRSTEVPASSTRRKQRILLLCDPAQIDSPRVGALRSALSGADVVTDHRVLRPGVLQQYDTVVDVAESTPCEFLRDCSVRGLHVVLVGREPGMLSLPAVVVDVPLSASYLARDLVLQGHRAIAVVESRGSSLLFSSVRQSALRYCDDANVDICDEDEVLAATNAGATAVVCASPTTAAIVAATLRKAGVDVPARVSLASVGAGTPPYPCSGYFVDVSEQARMVAMLLEGPRTLRPAPTWMTGLFHDAGSIAPPPGRTGPAGGDSGTKRRFCQF